MPSTSTNKIIKVALYARVSTDEQTKGYHHSIDNQIADLRKYAIEHNYVIVGEYIDAGVSSTRIHRPALDRLFENLKNIDMIIFYKLDRWVRPVPVYYRFQEILDRYKVEWKSITEDFDPSTANGRMHINVYLSFKQSEVDTSSERGKWTAKMQKEKGFLASGSVPVWFGRKRVEGGVILTVEEPDTIRSFISDCLSDCQISSHLADYGITYRRAKRLLTSEHLALVLTDQELLQVKNTFFQRSAYPTTHTPVFSSLIVCPDCGSKFGSCRSQRNGRTYQYYRCPKHKTRALRSCPNNQVVKEKELEKQLLDIITSTVDAVTVEKEPRQKKAKQKKPVDNTKKINRLNDLYIDGKIDKATYDKKYIELTNQIVRHENEPTKQAVPERFDTSVRDLYENMNNLQKRTFWRNLVHHVTLNEDGSYAIIFL